MYDIREVNYLRFTQKFRYPSKKVFGFSLKKGLLYGVCNFFTGFLLSFFRNPISLNYLIRKSHGSVILYGTHNQYNALICLYESIRARGEECVMIKASDLPLWRSYIFALSHSRSFWKEFYNASSEERKIIANEFATFWRSYGDYDLIKRWVRLACINQLIVASDISPLMRAGIMACNDSNVRTVYVQHAAVTDKFPPLISSYSFLDGEDSFEKYKLNKRVSSDVYIIGGARFDLAKPSNDKDESKSIGIALTLRDERRCWEQLIKSILNNFPDYKVILRPHPRMEKSGIKQFCNSMNIMYSDPLKENSFYFLDHIGLLIANETSTHLDAMIMHRPTILYSGLSTSGLRDHYGMIKKGLLKNCSSFEELRNYIMEPSSLIPDASKVRYYNASYLTGFEFKVSELISRILYDDNKLINGLIENNGVKYIDYFA